MIKKIKIYAFIQMYDFSSFLADFNQFFLSILYETSFCSTVNKCTIAIMIMIMINIKSFLEKLFLRTFENKSTFLFWIQPLWCTAKRNKFHAIYLVVTKEMVQIWHLCHELLNSGPKVWKPEGINYTMMEDLNLWQILAEMLFEFIS